MNLASRFLPFSDLYCTRRSIGFPSLCRSSYWCFYIVQLTYQVSQIKIKMKSFMEAWMFSTTSWRMIQATRQRKSSSIFLSSVAAHLTLPGQAGYAAVAKTTFLASLASALTIWNTAKSGLGIHLIHPGANWMPVAQASGIPRDAFKWDEVELPGWFCVACGLRVKRRSFWLVGFWWANLECEGVGGEQRRVWRGWGPFEVAAYGLWVAMNCIPRLRVQ